MHRHQANDQALGQRNWSNAGLPGQSSLYSVSDVAPTELILERQQVDVNIICALDLVWQLAPPDLLPLGVVRPSELKGHRDAPVHGFIQVMGPAHLTFDVCMYVSVVLQMNGKLGYERIMALIRKRPR